MRFSRGHLHGYHMVQDTTTLAHLETVIASQCPVCLGQPLLMLSQQELTALPLTLRNVPVWMKYGHFTPTSPHLFPPHFNSFSPSQAKQYYIIQPLVPSSLKTFLGFQCVDIEGHQAHSCTSLLSTQNSFVPQGCRRFLPKILTHAVPATRNALPHHLPFLANSHSVFGAQPKKSLPQKSSL